DNPGWLFHSVLLAVARQACGYPKGGSLRDLPIFVDGSAESVASDDRDVAGFGLGSARSGAAWARDLYGRWVLKWCPYSARTRRRCRALRMSIRSRSSRP